MYIDYVRRSIEVVRAAYCAL